MHSEDGFHQEKGRCGWQYPAAAHRIEAAQP